MKDIEKRLKPNTLFKLKKQSYQDNWSFLFQLADLGDLDQPLSKKILSDPQHKITKLLLYIYSMESFIYADLNKASREKDISKI